MSGAEKSSENIGQGLNNTPTSQNSGEMNCLGLTSFAADFPAKGFLVREKARDYQIHVRGYSLRWSELLRKPGQSMLSLRTFLTSLEMAWMSLAKSYGFGVINRSDLYLWKLPPLVRPTRGNEFSSSPSVKRWPTPTATERSGINPNTGKGGGLTKEVQKFPTPTAHPPGWKNIEVVDKDRN